MQKYLTIIILFTMIYKSYGQIPYEYKNVNDPVVKDSTGENKISYSFSSGLSVISGSHLKTGSTFYISPEITYNNSTNLLLTAGVIVTQNNYSVPVECIGDKKSEVIRQMPVANQNIFYLSGDYLLSPKIMISGSMISALPGNSSSTLNAGNMTNSFNSVNMEISYKITSKLSVTAGINIVHLTNNQ